MGCLDENTVDRLVRGELNAVERAETEAHVAACADCRMWVSEVAREPTQRVAGDSPAPAHEPHETLTFAGRRARSLDAERLFSIGERLADRYRIVRFLAEGGMGEVYEAEDLELRRRVALKTVRPEIASDERVIDRFRREINLAHRVSHPNVCRIFDFGVHQRGERVTFLTMEFLDGETLSERLRRSGALTTEQALPIVEQMAQGLAAAHAVGVVHRDFKSPNVMLVAGESAQRAVITDFGLAASSAADDLHASSTGSSGLVGSPAYMAPEQVEGRKVDHRADIYALGVVMFEMVTGVWPFVAQTPMLTAIQRLQQDAPSPLQHKPALDPRWAEVILCCLRRDPAERYASVLDVVRALTQEGDALTADAPSLVGRTIGNFVIKERLAVDAWTTTYAAEHSQMDRRVLVKAIHPRLSQNTEVVNRYVADAKTLSRLRHRNVTEILDFGKLDGCVCYTAEWVWGRSLAERLRDGAPPLARSVKIVADIGRALAAAHGEGVAHGKLTADSVYLVGSENAELVKVIDFGLARFTATSTEDMKAEQRADLSALDVLAQRMLAAPRARKRAWMIGSAIAASALLVSFLWMATGTHVSSPPPPRPLPKAATVPTASPPSVSAGPAVVTAPPAAKTTKSKASVPHAKKAAKPASEIITDYPE